MQWRKLTKEERDQNYVKKSSKRNVPRVAKSFTDITTTTTHDNNNNYDNKNNKNNTNKNNNEKKNNTAYLLREKKTSSLYCWEYILQNL